MYCTLKNVQTAISGTSSLNTKVRVRLRINVNDKTVSLFIDFLNNKPTVHRFTIYRFMYSTLYMYKMRIKKAGRFRKKCGQKI